MKTILLLLLAFALPATAAPKKRVVTTFTIIADMAGETIANAGTVQIALDSQSYTSNNMCGPVSVASDSFGLFRRSGT